MPLRGKLVRDTSFPACPSSSPPGFRAGLSRRAFAPGFRAGLSRRAFAPGFRAGLPANRLTLLLLH